MLGFDGRGAFEELVNSILCGAMRPVVLLCFCTFAPEIIDSLIHRWVPQSLHNDNNKTVILVAICMHSDLASEDVVREALCYSTGADNESETLSLAS